MLFLVMLTLPLLPLILFLGLALAIALVIFLWLTLRNKEAAPATPDRRAEAAIREQFAKVKAAESRAAELLARQEALAEELSQAEHEAEKWQKVIAAAVEAKNENDVREAVRQRMEAQQKAGHIKTALDESAKTLAGLKEQLRLAKESAQQSEADAAVLRARLESAKIRDDLAGSAGPAKAIADLEEETIKAEGRAEADEEIGGLEKGKVAAAQVDIDAEVERLMGRQKQG